METALDWAGQHASAKYALERNANLLSDAAAAIARARTEEDRTAAVRTFRELQSGIYSTDLASQGLNAGYSNAQAENIMQLVEAQIPRAMLDEVAEALYDINGWALTLDIESGRTPPGVAATFLRNPDVQPLLEALRAASLAYTSSMAEDSSALLASLEELRGQVQQAVRSNYVPMTGNPEHAATADVFGTGARQPNTATERRAEGRHSAPDDAITATMARVSRSASYNGWYPYQDRIADIYDALGSQEARNAAGLRREILPRTSTAVGGANRLIRRRGNRVEQYEFRDPSILGALQEYNSDAAKVWNGLIGLPSRAYAYMATQANFMFGAVNLIRDAWERSELIRSKRVRAADGSEIDMTRVGRRILALSGLNPVGTVQHLPGMFGATMRFAFGRAPRKDSVYDNMLQELSSQGGISTRSDLFAGNRKGLVANIANANSAKGRLARFISAYNRMFDLIPVLASHMALREAGASPQIAAGEALDLMNFNKRGKLTKFIAPFYSFSQTSFTGGANFIGAIYNPNSMARKVRGTHFIKRGLVRLAGTTLVMGAIQSLARALAGDEDEGGNKVDQINKFITDSNLVVPIPGASGFLRIPLAFGQPRVANGLASVAVGITSGEESAADALGHFASNNLATVLSPLEGNNIDMQERPLQGFLMTLSPSWMKPITAVAQNRDANDTPIVFDNYAKEKEYRSDQFGKNVPSFYKDVAVFMRKTFGVDLAPEEVESLIKSYPTGSIAQARQFVVDNPFAESRGKVVPNPLLARFYGAYGDGGKISQFYDGIEEANKAQRKLTARETVTSEERKLLNWRMQWDEIDTELRKESRAINALPEGKAKTDAQQRYQAKRREQQFLAVYRLRQAKGLPAQTARVPAKI